MNLALVLCAAIATYSPFPVVTFTPVCEGLPQPAIVILEARSCDGTQLADWMSCRICPPSSVTWLPEVVRPIRIEARVYAGYGMPLISTTVESFGCP